MLRAKETRANTTDKSNLCNEVGINVYGNKHERTQPRSEQQAREK